MSCSANCYVLELVGVIANVIGYIAARYFIEDLSAQITLNAVR